MNRLLPLFALLAAAACQPRYDGIELTLTSTPPVPVRISGTEIELPLGVAVAVDVEPQSSSRFNYYEDDPLELRSQDRAILRVEITEDPRIFVLVAVSPGETCVDIEVVGDDHGCIPATVLAKPN
ncbi:MAG: hypothetical protein H0T76_06740 [Nannocystis sp.]|nr:hypothetical protein [Nannocystis sp.]MBA3546159.1 hypothetical protein [Nannocystis sp.]